MSRWTADAIGTLHGKTAIVTGANSGLGFETAKQLALHGATVILACRNLNKGEKALAAIEAACTADNANVALSELDLSSLDSIAAFVGRFQEQQSQLDILCNNAGVMALPRMETKDGFEMQLGVNHLGHFALTGRLLDALCESPAARIVNVSSIAHRGGRIRFNDLQSKRSYQKWLAYGQSKLANLLFTYALDRRLRRASKRARSVIAVAAHPGYSATNLQFGASNITGSKLSAAMFKMGNAMAQSAAMGALPTLRAATGTDVNGGDYYGPAGLGEMRGLPKKVTSNSRSHNQPVQRRLFEVSEELTNVTFSL